VTVGVEDVVRCSVKREEPLRRSRRPETLHPTFSTTNVDVRSFETIVLPARLMMPGRQPKIPEGRGVGSQLVGYDRARSETVLLTQLPHELERGSLVTLGLDEDIQDLAVLVDGPSQIHGLFRPSRRTSRRGATVSAVEADHVEGDDQSAGRTSAADGFVGHLDPTFGQQFLNVAKAEGKASVQPDGVLDDHRGKWQQRQLIGVICRPYRWHGSEAPRIRDKALARTPSAGRG
jgi:hypothetical protein